jgi:hypothetical protein
MKRLPIAVPARAAAALLALSCLLAHAQQLPAGPGAATTPLQPATAASLNDSLMARATTLYSSTVKSGLHSFDCQVHPDWMKIMLSSRKGVALDSDDTRAALLGAVKITLHARLEGSSTLDWQAPPDNGQRRDQAAQDMLDRAHRSIESTLDGVLRLWIPLVDGSLAESFGEDDMEIAQTANGYVVRSADKSRSTGKLKDKQKSPLQSQSQSQGQSITEEFDRSLLLQHFTMVDAGSTASLTPAFQPTPQGLLVSSFDALLQPAGVPPADARQMHIALEYQTVSGIQIPGKIGVELPNVAEMDFTFDGCTVNPQY